MDIGIFIAVLGVGVALVVVQAVLSWSDGYLTQAQMRARGITNGWSFFEHGGMWADVFLISPIVAYLVAKYRIAYASKWGFLTLAFTVVLALIMDRRYRRSGVTVPEAHVHDGRSTPAGWVHGLYAVLTFWTLALFYLNQTSPPVAVRDVLLISALLIVFTYFGVAKFSSRWRLGALDKWQIAVEVAALLILAGAHVWLS